MALFLRAPGEPLPEAVGGQGQDDSDRPLSFFGVQVGGCVGWRAPTERRDLPGYTCNGAFRSRVTGMTLLLLLLLLPLLLLLLLRLCLLALLSCCVFGTAGRHRGAGGPC